MPSVYGKLIRVTSFGSSHGEACGVLVEGFPAGIKVDQKAIATLLQRRKPQKGTGTTRKEKDDVHFISGVTKGFTDGTPLGVTIPNRNTKGKDYALFRDTPRPSHADYAAGERYNHFNAIEGGGYFSGRLTAPLCVVGAIALTALKDKGIVVASHASRMAGVQDTPFDPVDPSKQVLQLQKHPSLFLDGKKEKEAQKVIEQWASLQDSCGGVIETVVLHLPAGLGNPMAESLESTLSASLFGIGGIKGIEFGDGFALADSHGSQTNDAFLLKGKKVQTRTNHMGGINGGLANGMPLIFRCAIKPTNSVSLPQETLNLKTKKETTLCIPGRHDPCFAWRVAPVIEAITALVLLDAMMVYQADTGFLGKSHD